ncbi:unnamed protein product [Pleuronectes platessa]|uniref:Uncharacterized protein n=1 Tax=Pleuronectes platessa TaxID=8262 RepID=A0A9N7Y431_PLEPL|nr:unnamed protein product [Pleuronectes platessa]
MSSVSQGVHAAQPNSFLKRSPQSSEGQRSRPQQSSGQREVKGTASSRQSPADGQSLQECQTSNLHSDVGTRSHFHTVARRALQSVCPFSRWKQGSAAPVLGPDGTERGMKEKDKRRGEKR